MAVAELSPSYKTQLSASQVSSLSTRFTNPRRILVPLLPRVKRVGIHCSVVSNLLYSVGYPFQKLEGIEASAFATKQSDCSSFKRLSVISRCSSTDDKNESGDQNKKPFGYTRKDVLLIGVGVTVIGVGLKSGLEFYGVDPLQAGNVVQLVIVLGLTVGWISTYMFRVSNKEMTYATQLRDYENKVMEKRLESLTEAELAVLMEQVEEEKLRVSSNE